MIRLLAIELALLQIDSAEKDAMVCGDDVPATRGLLYAQLVVTNLFRTRAFSPTPPARFAW